MLEQTNAQQYISQVEQLKENQLVLMFPFDVLKLINKLDITTSLDETYYIQHQIQKRNGSVRVLNEPKPNLKLVQKKLLDFIDYFAGGKNANLSHQNKLIDGVSAYRKKKSVIDNANFHIGQEFLLKLDIEDFFNRVDTSKLHHFWVEILQKAPQKVMKNYVFETNNTPCDLDGFIQSLATKLVYVTSLDFHLSQGSPTSGALANYYLANFDNRLLNYCIQRKLNYSRYSDDITISGKLEDLHTGNVLGAIQFMLKERDLKLNKTKTKLLRSNRKQMVTGIVVNVKKTAGRAYKRTIRQEVYYLKKFKEAHITKKKQNAIKYLENLLGKISWVHSIEKDDSEFKRYKGELVIINRFVKSGKSINEAIGYLAQLVELSTQLSSDEKVVVEGIEWKIEDESRIDSDYTIGVYTQTKRSKEIAYFDEVGLKNYLSTLKEGWRLPTVEEFKSYIKETHYDDRKLLGLTLPSDPNLNGVIQMNKSYSYNKIGGYWTSDMQHIRNSSTEYAIGRTVFLSFSKNREVTTKLNNKIEYFGKTSAFSNVNIENPIFKNRPKTYIGATVFLDTNSGLLQSFSLRLVRTASSTDTEVVNTHFSESFWNLVSKTKKSSKLEGLAIESIPLKIIQEWRSSSMLLSNNQLKKGLPEYPPVLKVDFRNNSLQQFDFDKIPNTVKHLLLAGNEELDVAEIPIKKFASHLHELTLPKQFDNQVEINYSDIYAYAIKNSVWFEIDSDEKLETLIPDALNIKHLKITIHPGSDLIHTSTLFKRLHFFENLVSLHVLIEPKEEGLLRFLNELKGKSVFTKEDLAFIESVKQNNPINSIVNHDDLQFWLYGKIDFVAMDLVNQKLKNLIFDFSWFQGVNFKGDFNLELERYHLLHPGTLPSNLPATSSSVHQPNILLKALGQKIQLEIEDVNASIIIVPKLFYILPFNSITMYYVFNDLFSLYPKNQRHLENIVLVLTSWQEKEISKGSIRSLFTKSNKYKSQQLFYKSSFQQSRSIFNFPLLSYSLNFDVYKLNNPVKTILFKPEIKADHFTLQNIKHPFGLGTDCLCYFNNSYINTYNSKFSSDDKIPLSMDNFLLVQFIFPNLYPISESENNYKVEEKTKLNQFKLRNRFYSATEVTKKMDKEALISLINETNFNPIHLPKKSLKDKAVMLTVAQNNPFSVIYAHKGLRNEEDFILNALKASIRTLMFFDRYLLNKEKGNKILKAVYNYLTSIFRPIQFNYIVNQLNKKVVVDQDEILLFFKFDVKNSSDVNLIMKSFEDEMIWWESDRWYSMSSTVRDGLIELAEKNNFFNKDGYFTNLELVATSNCDYLDLSYSDLSTSDENNNTALLSNAQRATIKTLNLSFTRLNYFELLKVFPSCEELYLDGLVDIYLNPNSLNERFPNLKRLYIRCLFKNEYTIRTCAQNCLNLEFIDARNKVTKDEATKYICSDGREILILGVNESIMDVI